MRAYLRDLFVNTFTGAAENFDTLAESESGKESKQNNLNPTENHDIRYSFRNSKSGMANDSLLPYNKEMKALIEKTVILLWTATISLLDK